MLDGEEGVLQEELARASGFRQVVEAVGDTKQEDDALTGKAQSETAGGETTHPELSGRRLGAKQETEAAALTKQFEVKAG